MNSWDFNASYKLVLKQYHTIKAHKQLKMSLDYVIYLQVLDKYWYLIKVVTSL